MNLTIEQANMLVRMSQVISVITDRGRVYALKEYIGRSADLYVLRAAGLVEKAQDTRMENRRYRISQRGKEFCEKMVAA